MTESLLLRRFPALAEHRGIVPLGNWPTPVVELDGVEPVGKLWVKRDDLSAQPYGGSKVRNLEWLLGDARARGRRTLLALGARGSHLVLALGVHGAAQGFGVRAVLTPQPVDEEMLRILARIGEAGVRTSTAHLFVDVPLHLAGHGLLSLVGGGGVPRWVPPGGASPVGCLGYLQAALEIAEQVEAGELPVPDYVYCAAGSCGTLVGLAEGFALAGLPSQVVGVRVVPRIATHRWRRRRLHRGLRRLLAREAGIDLPPPPHPVLLHDYAGRGYAHPTDEGRAVRNQLREGWGLVLDDTYTAKTLAGLVDHVERNDLAGKNHLFINTFDGT